MILEAFEEWLEEGGGTIGQVLVRPAPEGFELLHAEDETIVGALEVFDFPEAARKISKNNAAGEYRPLKSAATLVRGWLLRLKTSAEILAALDVFYPAAVGMWARYRKNPGSPKNLGSPRVVPFRETLERQTGMYRYARTISGEGRQKIIEARCHKTCLRRILWDDDQSSVSTSKEVNQIPIFCPEICNLLVADARLQARREHLQAQES